MPPDSNWRTLSDKKNWLLSTVDSRDFLCEVSSVKRLSSGFFIAGVVRSVGVSGVDREFEEDRQPLEDDVDLDDVKNNGV